MNKCSYCGEEIPKDAVKCRHCAMNTRKYIIGLISFIIGIGILVIGMLTARDGGALIGAIILSFVFGLGSFQRLKKKYLSTDIKTIVKDEQKVELKKSEPESKLKCMQTIKDWLDSNPLEIGTLDEFQKRQ